MVKKIELSTWTVSDAKAFAIADGCVEYRGIQLFSRAGWEEYEKDSRPGEFFIQTANRSFPATDADIQAFINRAL